ncbi:hypothetical protein A4G28_26730 [Mycobacterium ostraviense]|uniref:Uncharacterized protein n=1 Tax=Mycobacterium ostraviense TaxID=2738409 RepID=A0A162DH65_9MYCO|nr:hypothetical protein A4G28_26730 [Mycobacterium ostraviense]
MLVRMCEATRRPTIIRLKAPMRKHTYATPAQLGTNVRSVTHSWLGAVAVKSRPTRSGWRGAPGSSLVVRTRLPWRFGDPGGPHQSSDLVAADIVARRAVPLSAACEHRRPGSFLAIAA